MIEYELVVHVKVRAHEDLELSRLRYSLREQLWHQTWITDGRRVVIESVEQIDREDGE